MKFLMMFLAAALVSAGSLPLAFANESETQSDVKEAVADTKKETKKLGRKVKDETCELVNGKMECTAKKVGNKAKNVGDEVKDAVDSDN